MTQTSKRSRRESAGHRPGRDVGELLEPRFFRALCDCNRVAILGRLAKLGRPCTVSEVAQCCPVNISVVSRHLAMLRDAGILDAQKRGKEVHYSVRYPELVATLRGIADAVEACCPGANRPKLNGGDDEQR